MGVRDVNDNRPVFVDQEYFGTVAEEQPIGTSATLVSSLVGNELINMYPYNYDTDRGGGWRSSCTSYRVKLTYRS